MLELLLAACLQDAEVVGTVTSLDKPRSRGTRRYPGSKTGEHLRGPAVVFLDGVPGPFQPSERPRLVQKQRQFSPLALPVLKGTTVEFPNEDEEYHNVFSRSSAKEFDLGRYAKGSSKTETFDKPGLVRLRCEVHSHMHAVIVVLENPYFTVTDDKGNYAIRKVPPGKYRLYAFHEDYEAEDRKADPLRVLGRDVEIPKTGSVRADFDLSK